MSNLDITFATSIKYGNYKQHHATAVRIKRLLTQFKDLFDKAFDHKCTNVHIRPLKGKHGCADVNGAHIEIDPRRSTLKAIVETLAHEFTHSEQFKQQRLEHNLVGPCFEGKQFKNAYTFKQYWKQPWEVEARARAEKFIEENWQHINVNYLL